MADFIGRGQWDTVSLEGLYTCSPQVKAFLEKVKRAARVDSAILIRGETGTGKELVGAALHRLSARHDGPYHAINCATLTPELMASEMFGHEKGAFTGATAARQGMFEASHGGTLFLDEIAEAPLEIQSRLLRVVQDHMITRLGSVKARHVDVRLISATHKSLRRESEAGRFRSDLMYRLRVVPLFLPPLRERGEDIMMLTWRFIDEFNARGGRQILGVSVAVRDCLMDYPWPGNVRELRNNIEVAFALGEGEVLLPGDLTPELQGRGPDGSLPGLEEQEKLAMLAAIAEAGGHKGRAAEAMGMARATFWRKLKKYNL